jgi:thiol-disulfide isomerase/thioredoxin
MSGLLFAGDNDFFLSQSNNGNKMLCTKINGPVLVLFYSTQCQYCKKLIPIFKKLTGTIGQCSFAMVNIGKARQVIKDSTFTKNPIEYVPYIIFYVNNKPYMKYKGPPEASEIQKFAVQVCNNLSQRFTQQIPQQTQGGNPQMNQQQPQGEDQGHYDENGMLIEYTTIGTPLYGDDDDEKCYLNFDDAYPEEELKPGQKGDIRNSTKHYKKWEIAYPDIPYENYKSVPRKNVNPFAKQPQMAAQGRFPQRAPQGPSQGRGPQGPSQQQIMAAQMAQQKQMIAQQQMAPQHQQMIPRQPPQRVSEMVHQQVLAQQQMASQMAPQMASQRGPQRTQQMAPQMTPQNAYAQQMAQQQRAMYSHPTSTMSLGKGKASASGRRNVNRR